LATAIIVAIYFLFSHKLKADSAYNTGFGILLCLSCFSIVYVIPTILSTFRNLVVSNKLTAGGITQEAYVAQVAFSQMISYLNPLHLIAVVLLLCAYSMYWYRTKYC